MSVGKREIKTEGIPVHAMFPGAVAAEFGVDPEKGLLGTEAGERLAKYGPNVITEKKQVNPFIIFLRQFKGPFVLMLFFAAALSFWFREWLDGIAILAVVFINAAIGFFMEYKAERSMVSLRKLTQLVAKVKRNGVVAEIRSDHLVPGDMLMAEAGDVILADARVYQCAQLEVDESALTGESLAVAKDVEPVGTGTPLADRKNMLFKGTFIAKGNVHAIVTGTGMHTELGKIAMMVQGAEQTATPLEKKVTQFSKKILWLTVALIGVLFISGILRGDDIMEMLSTSIALAVAAIPEGLPIVTTLALAQGMLRMARHHVIIKKLAAVETLGGTNVICTDKTGTLTQNKIEVHDVIVPEGWLEIKQDIGARKLNVVNGQAEILDSENFGIVRLVAVLCNTADINYDKGELKETGDPLETGLLKFAYSHGADVVATRDQYPKTAEEPFTSETRIMATQHKGKSGSLIAAKGAVEELLKRCEYIRKEGKIEPLNESQKKDWVKQADELAASGSRVIAMAYKETNNESEPLSDQLIFVALIGLLDPPREAVYQAIAECKSAGIQVIMITGDHPATAKTIGTKLGLQSDGAGDVIHGKSMSDYESLSAEERKRWLGAKIFARVTPKQKLDLITVLQENKATVGMTGDGVNDAPALKKADIGIAMGQRGTQVAQDAADIILKDDSFSSIVIAIKSGRIIYENIRKFIMYLLSCNLSELFIITFSTFLSLHYALIPLQILYINLVTDVLPALALGVTEGSNEIMKIPPRSSAESLIDRRRWVSIFVYSIIIGACSVGAVIFAHYTIHPGEGWNGQLCNNVLFITIILSQLWNVLNMTTDNSVPIYRTDVFRNIYVWIAIGICLLLTFGIFFIEPVAKVLMLEYPSGADLSVMCVFSVLSLIIIRILKRLKLIL